MVNALNQPNTVGAGMEDAKHDSPDKDGTSEPSLDHNARLLNANPMPSMENMRSSQETNELVAHFGPSMASLTTTQFDPAQLEMQKKRQDKLWELMGEYIGHDKISIQKQIVNHIEYTFAKSRFDFNINHCALAIKKSLFDRLIE